MDPVLLLYTVIFIQLQTVFHTAVVYSPLNSLNYRLYYIGGIFLISASCVWLNLLDKAKLK